MSTILVLPGARVGYPTQIGYFSACSAVLRSDFPGCHKGRPALPNPGIFPRVLLFCGQTLSGAAIFYKNTYAQYDETEDIRCPQSHRFSQYPPDKRSGEVAHADDHLVDCA